MDATDWAALGTWVTVMVYLAILMYAVKQVEEAKRLRRAQTRPFVVVDVTPGYSLYITVENIGTTLARNVRFRFPVQLKTAVEDDSPDVQQAPIFRDGLTVLPPRKRYRVFFDAFLTRMERKDLPMAYDVVVEYEDDEGHPYEDPYTLDLNSFLHTSLEEKGLPDLVAEVEEIRKTAAKWTDATKGLLVHARDKDAMLKRQHEALAERRKTREEQNAADQSQGTGGP